MTSTELCDMAYWWPILAETGLRVPRTILVTARCPLAMLAYGEPCEGLDAFLSELRSAADAIGYPCFLRSGQTSAKHYWKDTCHVPSGDVLKDHVRQIVEFSEVADLLGLPVKTWAVREFLPLRHAFTAFDGMPVAREFRCFVRDGKCECMHPYWPPESILSPSRPDWRPLLDDISGVDQYDRNMLETLAEGVGDAFGGFWSVDLAQHEDGRWFVTDMATGDRSYHWPDCELHRARRVGGAA